MISSLAHQLGVAPVSDVLQIIHSDHSNTDSFKSTFERINDCEDVVQRN